MSKNTNAIPAITVIIHDYIQAAASIRIAKEVGLSLQLETPDDMAEALGPMWLRGLIHILNNEKDLQTSEVKIVFNCGISIGLAQAACAAELPAIRLEPKIALSDRTKEALIDIAEASGTELFLNSPPKPCLRCPPPGGTPKVQTLENFLREQMLSLSSGAKIS